MKTIYLPEITEYAKDHYSDSADSCAALEACPADALDTILSAARLALGFAEADTDDLLDEVSFAFANITLEQFQADRKAHWTSLGTSKTVVLNEVECLHISNGQAVKGQRRFTMVAVPLENGLLTTHF